MKAVTRKYKRMKGLMHRELRGDTPNESEDRFIRRELKRRSDADELNKMHLQGIPWSHKIEVYPVCDFREESK